MLWSFTLLARLSQTLRCYHYKEFYCICKTFCYVILLKCNMTLWTSLYNPNFVLVSCEIQQYIQASKGAWCKITLVHCSEMIHCKHVWNWSTVTYEVLMLTKETDAQTMLEKLKYEQHGDYLNCIPLIQSNHWREKNAKCLDN